MVRQQDNISTGELTFRVTHDGPRRHHKCVQRGELQKGNWDGTTYEWLGERLNVDTAHDAANALLCAIRLIVDRTQPSQLRP